jgi:hypothetical protein
MQLLEIYRTIIAWSRFDYSMLLLDRDATATIFCHLQCSNIYSTDYNIYKKFKWEKEKYLNEKSEEKYLNEGGEGKYLNEEGEEKYLYESRGKIFE